MTRPRTRMEVADLEWRMERELAGQVPCPRCRARVGESCWNTDSGEDLRAPAHWQRIRDARKGT
jgi:hypothetical protein